MKMKHFALPAFAFLLLIFSSCSKSTTNPTSPAPGGGGVNNNAIDITGMSFPASVTVAKGSTVKWTNSDAMAHTVTSDDGTTFNSGTVAAGASYSYQANTAGTFPYHCNFHSGMKGTLIVKP